MEIWPQNYDPLGNAIGSTIVAALPVVVLLGFVAFLKVRIHVAAFVGLVIALILAVGVFHMPADAAAATTLYGAAFGLFPIGWIILNVIFLYQLTVQRSLFAVLRDSLSDIAPDARIQVILIAFSFGAFLEGMAGFGTPVAITAAILIQLGFRPLHASGLALIANTAPVAFGSLGIPVTTLAEVAGLDVHLVSAMVGRQLPFFSMIIPCWIVVVFAGWRGLAGVWPAALLAGVSFAIPRVSRLELPRPMAGRYHFGRLLHRRRGAVSARLAAAGNHAPGAPETGGPRRPTRRQLPRRFPRRSRRTGSRSSSPGCRGRF